VLLKFRLINSSPTSIGASCYQENMSPALDLMWYVYFYGTFLLMPDGLTGLALISDVTRRLILATLDISIMNSRLKLPQTHMWKGLFFPRQCSDNLKAGHTIARSPV